jgi:hypothetical protein
MGLEDIEAWNEAIRRRRTNTGLLQRMYACNGGPYRQ